MIVGERRRNQLKFHLVWTFKVRALRYVNACQLCTYQWSALTCLFGKYSIRTEIFWTWIWSMLCLACITISKYKPSNTYMRPLLHVHFKHPKANVYDLISLKCIPTWCTHIFTMTQAMGESWKKIYAKIEYSF